jgi:hypothetical protein
MFVVMFVILLRMLLIFLIVHIAFFKPLTKLFPTVWAKK